MNRTCTQYLQTADLRTDLKQRHYRLHDQFEINHLKATVHPETHVTPSLHLNIEEHMVTLSMKFMLLMNHSSMYTYLSITIL